MGHIQRNIASCKPHCRDGYDEANYSYEQRDDDVKGSFPRHVRMPGRRLWEQR